MENKTILIIHESTLSSAIKDIVTFGMMGLLLMVNKNYLGDHASIAVLLVILALMTMYGKKSFNYFSDKKSAIEFINKLDIN